MKLAFCKLVYNVNCMNFLNIIEAFEDMGFRFNDDFTYDPEIYIENLKKFFLKKFEESEIKLNENENTTNNNGKENNMSFLKNIDKNEVMEKSPISDVPKDIIFFLRVASLLHGLCTQMNVKINYLSIFSKRAKEALENIYKPIDTSIYVTPISKKPKTFLEKRIHNFIKKLYEKEKILGCQICIIYKKNVVVDTCVGMTGVVDRRPITRHSLFNGYSLNKLILNIALIHLIYNKNNDEELFENGHLNVCTTNQNGTLFKQSEKDVASQKETNEIDKISGRCDGSKNVLVINKKNEKKENQNYDKINNSKGGLDKKKKPTQIYSEKEIYKNIESEKIKKFKKKLDTPISNYWDGFICNNKKHITIKDFLTLKCFIRKPFHENITLNKFINYNSMISMIENAKNYNVKNRSKMYGEYMYLIDTYIMSELIYNISGLAYHEYIYKNIIKPLNLEEEMFIPLPSYFLKNINDKKKKTNQKNKNVENSSNSSSKISAGFGSSNNLSNVSSSLMNIKNNGFSKYGGDDSSHIESYYNSKGNQNISNFKKKKYDYKGGNPFFMTNKNAQLSNNFRIIKNKNKRMNGVYNLSNNLSENKFINISTYNYKINKNNSLININEQNELIKKMNRSSSIDAYFTVKESMDVKKKIKSESVEKVNNTVPMNLSQQSCSDLKEDVNKGIGQSDTLQSFKEIEIKREHDKENENDEEDNFYDAKDNLTESEMKSDKGGSNKVYVKCKSIEINEGKNNGKQKDVFSLKHTFLNHVDNLKEKTKKINDSIKNIYENNENMFLKNLFTSQKKTDKDNFDNNKDCRRDKNYDFRNIEYKHLYEKKNIKKIRKRDIFFESILKDGKLNNIDKMWYIKNINKLKSPLKILEKNSKKISDVKNNSKRRSISCNNFNHENDLFKNVDSNEDGNDGYKKGRNNGNANYQNNKIVSSMNDNRNLHYKNKKKEPTYNKKESIPAIFVNNIILEPKVDVIEKRESIIIKNYEEFINNNLNFNESIKELCENVVSENSSEESVNSILKEDYNNYQKKKNIKYKKLYKYINELKEYVRDKEKQLDMMKKNEIESNSNSFIFENVVKKDSSNDNVFNNENDSCNKNGTNSFQANTNNSDAKQKEVEYEAMKTELNKEKNLLKKLIDYKYLIIKKQIENVNKRKTKKMIYNNVDSDEYAMFSDTECSSNYDDKNYIFNDDYLKMKDRNIKEKIKKLETYLIMKKAYKKNDEGHIPEINHTINKNTDVCWKLVYSKRNESMAEKLSDNGNPNNNFENLLNTNMQKSKKKVTSDNASDDADNDTQKDGSNKDVTNMKKESENNSANTANPNEQGEKMESKLKSYLNNSNSKQSNKYITIFQLAQDKPYVLDPLIYDSKKILDKYIPINGRYTAKALTKILAFTNENIFFPSNIMNIIRKVYTIEESIESFVLTGGMSRKWGLGFQLFECEYDGEINEEFAMEKKKKEKRKSRKYKTSRKIVGYGQSDCSGCFTLSFPEINLSITLLLSDLYKGAEAAHLILEYVLKLYGIRPKWKVPIKVSNLLKVL
ncbi:atypical protein kinase, ABC-1 family, putative [Plasmodium vinckei vinckei]|uniref:Atypical protein kinase, ABC-1 family, putative n=1 Tax=Plasmodium vinckei vinckei TaxID=54757 RepID=A0A449BUH7_PLAVN|nr:atypical protein kinase, ABC-1 family, putative [Plasmodium vinckei vinckei]VEV56989.1 atypical protein kinase, ABC-1 family, putative [Plasmodium vinckei vinckei]